MVSKMIVLPLLMLMATGIFTSLYVLSASSMGDSFGGDVDGSGVSINGSAVINGTDGFSGDYGSIDVLFSYTSFASSFFIASLGILAVAGIQVVGSGLNDTGTKAVAGAVVWYLLWGVFSVFGLLGLAMIPEFGFPLYFVMTFAYGIGVYESSGGM